jgi:hypothetical protein
MHRGGRTSQVTDDAPIYRAVAAELGWSPDSLSPPLDLSEFLADAQAKATAHAVLMNAAAKDNGEKEWTKE